MNARRLYLLLGAAVLAVAIAMVIQTLRKPRVDLTDEDRPLVPQLHDHLNDVTSVTLTGAENKTIATLKRGDKGWGLEEKGGYLADVGKIREFLLKLDASRLLEPKTSNPNRYADVGLDDVKNKDAKGVRVDIAGLAQPTSVIIGVYNGANGVGTFVRREGDAQTWIASGNLAPSQNSVDWIKRDLMDIPAARWKSITLTATDGKKVVVYKDRPEENLFKLADVPKGRETAVSVLSGLAANLDKFKMQDVVPAKNAAPPDKANTAEWVAFDGLIVTAVAWQKEGTNYAQFVAKLDPNAPPPQPAADQKDQKPASDQKQGSEQKPDAEQKPADQKQAADQKPAAEQQAAQSQPATQAQQSAQAQGESDQASVRKEVETLNQAFSGWTFELQPYRYINMVKTTEDFLDPLPPKMPAVQPAQALPPGLTLPNAKGTTAGGAKTPAKPGATSNTVNK